MSQEQPKKEIDEETLPLDKALSNLIKEIHKNIPKDIPSHTKKN